MKPTRLNSILSVFGLIIFLSSIKAQDWCAIPEAGFRSEEEDVFNQYVIDFEENGGHFNTDVKILPVVVHVVYNTATDTTIMNLERVQMAIDRANIYMRRQNADTVNTYPDFIPVASDIHIELCLATKKTDGSSFNGVVYTSAFDESQLFDVTKYLNIIVDPNNLAAYASYPWAPTDSGADGIFIGYAYFGYYHPGMDEINIEGKTLVHEVGHYLGLYHTFHGGLEHLGDCSVIDDPELGDRCADTPLDWSFFPIPGDNCDIPMRYCENGDSLRAQVENYMHYNRDECLNMFSYDQRTRMRACLDSIRAALVSPENHIFTGISCTSLVSVTNPEIELNIELYPDPTQDVFYIANTNSLNIQRVNIYNQLGQLINTINNNSPQIIDVRGFSAGIYFVEIEIANQKLVRKIIKQ